MSVRFHLPKRKLTLFTNLAERTIDASGEKIAFHVMPMESGNVRKIRFRTVTVTTGDTLKITCQDPLLDGTAFRPPDGVEDQTVTILIDDTDDNTNHVVTLDSDRAVVAGVAFCVVMEFDSWVAGDLGIAVRNAANIYQVWGTLEDVGAGWVDPNRSHVIECELDDGTILEVETATTNPGLITGSDVNLNGAGKVLGLGFVAPKTMSVLGAYHRTALAGDCTLRLYDSSDTLLATSPLIDASARLNTFDVDDETLFTAPFAEVTEGSTYRLVWFDEVGGANIALSGLQLRHADSRRAYGCASGQFECWQTSSNAAPFSWVDTEENLPSFSVLFEDLPSAGGVRRHPGLDGGLSA